LFSAEAGWLRATGSGQSMEGHQCEEPPSER
jgi:hypothetical protein